MLRSLDGVTSSEEVLLVLFGVCFGARRQAKLSFKRGSEREEPSASRAVREASRSACMKRRDGYGNKEFCG
jgi:hypothetical protein